MPKYTPTGLPDIIILHAGKFIGLEVKRPNRNTGAKASEFAATKSTPAQEFMKQKIIENGGYYHISTSLEDAQDYLLTVYPM